MDFVKLIIRSLLEEKLKQYTSAEAYMMSDAFRPDMQQLHLVEERLKYIDERLLRAAYKLNLTLYEYDIIFSRFIPMNDCLKVKLFKVAKEEAERIYKEQTERKEQKSKPKEPEEDPIKKEKRLKRERYEESIRRYYTEPVKVPDRDSICKIQTKIEDHCLMDEILYGDELSLEYRESIIKRSIKGISI